MGIEAHPPGKQGNAAVRNTSILVTARIAPAAL
jgi:hypothetical protein